MRISPLRKIQTLFKQAGLGVLFGLLILFPFLKTVGKNKWFQADGDPKKDPNNKKNKSDSVGQTVAQDSLFGATGIDQTFRVQVPNCLVPGATIGDDTLYAGELNCNTAFGLAGNDFLYGYEGATNDTLLLNGGPGSDHIYAANLYGPNVLYGGAGSDTIYGGTYYGDNLIFAGDDPDTVTAYSYYGNNFVDAGTGDDQVAMTSGYGTNNCTLGSGNDLVEANSNYGNNVLYGNDGDDAFQAYSYGGSNTIFGGAGADRFVASAYTMGNTVYGGSENDSGTMFSQYGNNHFEGDTGDDSLYTGAYGGANYAYGGAGNDAIVAYSYQGDNFIYGGTDNDSLRGRSDSGNNQIFGEDGNDHLTGINNYGNNFVDGGAGDDLLYGYSYNSNTHLSGGADNDLLRIGTTNTYVNGAYYGVGILDGGPGNDLLYSHDLNDTLIGGGGMDQLIAYAGDDYMSLGDNTFISADGGDGTDELIIDFSVDLFTSGTLTNLERIDITGTGNNTMAIDVSHVVNGTGGTNSLTLSDTTWVIDGNTGDAVDLSGGFVLVGTGNIGLNTYNIYDAPTPAHIWIRDSVSVQLITNLELEDLIAGFELYPNPTDGNFSIELSNLQQNEATIEIFDLQGRSVFQQSLATTSGRAKADLRLENLPSGFYSVLVRDGQRQASRKIIVQ